MALIVVPNLGWAATNQAPVKLAIIAENAAAEAAADVLTVEFSKDGQVQLLERQAVGTVYREQARSAAGADYLKLGQVLGADGLLLLTTGGDKGASGFNLQLIAVKPGVLLTSGRFDQPTAAMQEWAAVVHRYFQPLLPKLGVLRQEAVPISIVNLRSAIQSVEAREAERQLTLLAVERLSREPQLFVLERRRMQLLTAEKDLQGLDEDAFWKGSFLLDGMLDNGGYSPKTITLSARLTPPKGGAPVTIEVSGSRTNFTEVVNRLADKVLEAVKLGRSSQPWNASEEAAQFFAEAQWALKWGLYPQAQMAIESAWALGKRDAAAAALSVRAHSENVPMGRATMVVRPDFSAQDNICILTIPEADKLVPLARALEVFHQNAPVLLSPTNVREAGFETGLQLLRRSAGVLESFYYAAEARVGQEDELASLRRGLRDIIGDLEAHPPDPAVRHVSWDDPRQNFKWLKWEEAGICAEEPEAALPMARQLLAEGYHPAGLPRVVGWSWSSRQRVPKLERQWVDEVCVSTNPGVRLEGLYLAMLLAPEDEQGSRRKSEEALVAAMWENRDWLCSDADRVSLVARIQRLLARRYDNTSGGYFSYEPFTSFKHRLRMDYLTSYTGTNLAVFQALFPNTNVKLESPEQARELLPLVLKLKQRLPAPGALLWSLQKLEQRAGEPVTPEKKLWEPQTDTDSANLVEAKFIRWNLPRRDVSPGRKPRFGPVIERSGLLWSRVRYVGAEDYAWRFDPETPTSYVAVNPRTGVQVEIPFPLQFGVPGELFAASSNTLYVEAKGHLYACQLTDKAWKEIPVPMEGATQMVWTKGRLLVCRSDGLMEVQPESGLVRLLVSSRRQPVANVIDPLWTPTTHLFCWSDGRLGALTENYCLTLDPVADKWDVREVSLTRTNNQFPQRLWSASGYGAQWFMGWNGPGNDYVVGFWDDDKPSETLLVSQMALLFKMAITNAPPPAATRWDWPQAFVLDSSSVAMGDRRLSILCPRKNWMDTHMPVAQEFVKFADDRQATLLRFEPDFRTPLKAGIRFEDDGNTDRPKINGTAVEMLHPLAGGFAAGWNRFTSPGASMPVWLETPAGLVFGGPGYGGHWLISNASLEKTFETQRQLMRQQTPSRTAGAVTPNKL